MDATDHSKRGSTTLAGVLTIIGSGETAPTMVATHRAVIAALAPSPEPAILLDTPFGFQENADDLVARARRYFATSLGRDLTPVSFRSREEAGDAGVAEFEAAVAAARFVFAGPGSPTYALQQWRGTRLAALLADTLRAGGGVSFASAAAVTLGRFALPVYDIYKVGSAPHWLDGLDVLGLMGIDAAVIPHFDNAEGGTHDTRYCYMGERRLRTLEAMLPAETAIIGVDEHTACIIDWDAGTVRVAGRGWVTVRRGGGEITLPAGETTALDALRGEALPVAAPPRTVPPRPPVPTLLEAMEGLEAEFGSALEAGDARRAVHVILTLEQIINDWAVDSEQSDAAGTARSALRAMVVRLGNAATAGLVDPKERVAGYVEALLELRDEARDGAAWRRADRIRDRLIALGVEVRDTADGSVWELTEAG